jgi:hypothetical protein
MKVTFRSPVFLYSGQQYAFVVHPQGSNPDMYFWVAELGEPLIGPTIALAEPARYTNRPKTGTLYTTNNDRTWDIVPNFDLKITFNRAKFSTDVDGVALLGNQPIQLLRLSNTSTSFSNYGENIYTFEKLGFTGNGTSAINITDIITGANSGVSASIASVNNGIMIVDNRGFQSGENVSLSFANSTPKGFVARITSVAEGGDGTLRIYKDSSLNTTMQIYDTNGLYAIGDRIKGENSNVTSEVIGINDMKYSVLDFEPSYLLFSKTSCGFEISPDAGTTYYNITENENYSFKTEQSV